MQSVIFNGVKIFYQAGMKSFGHITACLSAELFLSRPIFGRETQMVHCN